MLHMDQKRKMFEHRFKDLDQRMSHINDALSRESDNDRANIARLNKQVLDLQQKIQQSRHALRNERSSMQKKTQDELHRVKDQLMKQ